MGRAAAPRALASQLAGAALALLSAMQCSCTGLTYVTQAAVGENDLLVRARDIDELVQGDRVDARMRRLLSRVGEIKRFGEAHGLKATTNYTKYVRVDRHEAVWVVSASAPLEFRSKSWTFPLVGSFTYLGWFKRPQADEFAGELRREGWDVDVRGAGAFSTNGYFEDPVVSTMIAPGPEATGELANVILHESAHATIFVRSQSTFNESVANFVGNTLGGAYVAWSLGATSPEAVAYETRERSRAKAGEELHAAYVALDALYGSPEPAEAKLAAKRELLAALEAKVRATRPINNATLIQYRTYNSGQRELGELLAACGGDWTRFVAELKTLEAHPPEPAQQSDVGKIVEPLVAGRCEPGTASTR